MDGIGGIGGASLQQLLPQANQSNYGQKTKAQQMSSAKDLELRNACTDFEAVLTSTILKEGLNSAMAMNGDSDRDKGSQTYMELANEQMAQYVGKTGLIGIGDQLYRDIKIREMGVR